MATLAAEPGQDARGTRTHGRGDAHTTQHAHPSEQCPPLAQSQPGIPAAAELLCPTSKRNKAVPHGTAEPATALGSPEVTAGHQPLCTGWTGGTGAVGGFITVPAYHRHLYRWVSKHQR